MGFLSTGYVGGNLLARAPPGNLAIFLKGNIGFLYRIPCTKKIQGADFVSYSLCSLTWFTHFVQHAEVQTQRSGKGGVLSRTHGNFYIWGEFVFAGTHGQDFAILGIIMESIWGSPVMETATCTLRLSG